jgi:hypothetical protein
MPSEGRRRTTPGTSRGPTGDPNQNCAKDLLHYRRKVLGVGRMDSEGSRELIRAAYQKGAAAIKSRTWTEQERQERRQRARALGLGQQFPVRPHGGRQP